jgi:hypothetical protein
MNSRIPRYLVRLLVLVITLAVTACGSATPPPVSGKKSATDDFIYALRWKRYEEAATFFTSEHRRAFLDQFDALGKDLTVTDVRMKRIQPRDNGRSAEAVLEMDYQRLPSANLKTLRIDQTWVYFETGDAEGSGFLITTPFPKFPEELSRGKAVNKGTLPP